MTTTPDLVVLGGGIAGVTAALAAADRGLRVTLIDQARAGAASRGSAGILAPSLEGLPHTARPAAEAARDLYPRFLERLRSRTDQDVALDRSGIIEVASSDADVAALAARAPTAERLDAAALASLEPALAAHSGGVLYAGDGFIDNVALMAALDVAVARQSRIARITDEVASLDARGNLPAFRSRGGTRYAGRRLLLAGGAWAAALPGLPRTLPVRPVRGQLARLEGAPLRHAVFGGGGYVLPRRQALLVGATSEDAGFDTATTPRGLRTLRAIASTVVPSLAKAPLLEHWAALRPISSDGLPILGTEPLLPALTYACGYSRNGILFAPWAAEQLATTLAGGKTPDTLAPFVVTRFDELA